MKESLEVNVCKVFLLSTLGLEKNNDKSSQRYKKYKKWINAPKEDQRRQPF